MSLLVILLLIPTVTSLLLLFPKKGEQIKQIALTGSIIQLGFATWLTTHYMALRAAGEKSEMLFTTTYTWFAPLKINFAVGVDGIALAMVMLTAMVVVAGVLVSWKIESRVKEFFFLLTFLSVGAYGFFVSLDLFMLFFFLELAVIPKYLLIGIWGSGQKEKNAMKLALMLMGGSALVFLGLIGLY